MGTLHARLGILMVVALVIMGCGGDDGATATSSRAYKGHNSDIDTNNLVNAYPALVATRLDDCQTCHRGGAITSKGKEQTVNQCNFCHLYVFPSEDVTAGAPTGYEDTLNPYGKDYLTAGKTVAALKSIAGKDSDGDGHTNAAEIAALRYPGDSASYPGQTVAPAITLTWEELSAMPSHSQFHLLNASKQAYDAYIAYKGVKVATLLSEAGVDLTNATGITMLAADGFEQHFTMEEVTEAFPGQIFYANLEENGALLGANGFVTYSEESLWPAGTADMGIIPGEAWLLLAMTRENGELLESGYLDTTTGKINGEGPYRGVIPQATPGRPDRGSGVTPVGDAWDYDSTLDHNAGECPKTVVAIRIDPMPEGYEEFDWKNGGWALVDAKQIIIYGNGVTAR